MVSHNDESVSPLSRSPGPGAPSPAVQKGIPAALRQSGLRSELSNDDISEDRRDLADSSVGTRKPVIASSTEVIDYINGGQPHDVLQEGVHANGSSNGSALLKPALLLSSPSIINPVSNDGLSPSVTTGTITPPGRRSVQFARTGAAAELGSLGTPESPGLEDGDGGNRERKGSYLISKLRALATSGGLQTHSRSQSAASALNEEASSPSWDRSGGRVHDTLEEEGSDIDADAEETADEGAGLDLAVARRRRRIRRPQYDGPQTAPTTPNTRRGGHSESPATNGHRQFNAITRRNTMPDDLGQHQTGLSEGEGRDRLGKENAWRRGSSWLAGNRGQSYVGQSAHESDDAPTGRRPSNFRRLAGLGGGSDNDTQSPRRPFLGGERATTFGASRWKIIKQSLKMLGQKKEEHKIDYLKSAELMAELRAGAPAVLMLASMIQRDEHGNKRIPVLLEQLKLLITDSRSREDVTTEDTDRHLIFRIELEYGNGPNRMKWVINRSLRDFINLHLRYKLQASSDKYIQLRDIDARPKQPRFPRSAFPYLRGVRGLGESDDEDVDAIRVEDTVGEATNSEAERPIARRKKSRPGFSHRRRSSAVLGIGEGGESAAVAAANVKRAFNERQRRNLEQYLQEMIRWLIFRADSNRLCKFLELSALGIRLAAEGSYHGKEGYLVIQTSKGVDFRKVLTPKAIFARHSPKWFLVRHSYIVCVDSPENMHIYDVFLLDTKFEVQKKRRQIKDEIREAQATGVKHMALAAKTSAAHPQEHHRLKLQNSERKLRLLAKNERQLRQFEESITFMMNSSPWSKPNRFDSFAPIRQNVYAQWLVDGRDYMWNVSRAINMAKDVIYIHDWWLSPQVYMRRPAAISQKWRLDRLLRKKAREGVKIFIIIYRNVEAAVPIDSEYTKFSMLDLHPNVFLQRSPNQFKKNQFFFAHHEKICIVDHTVAFVGGIDLCFGRWDTPQHSVCDDKPTGFEHSDEPKDADHCQLWPGKDYSNPRVQDFFQLNEPYAEMYDRSKTPRMPWHDIAMQVVGHPARDLTRHFVQRWNYILRGRKPTRPTPFLLPPPDYNSADLEALGLNGTCEVQILRSASMWSLGLIEAEHSIMNAYCKMIEESEHFVYMENQFFITSTETMGVRIVNKIGDALVERIVRAHKNNEDWRCIILIPLMPGFQNTVDAPDGTSVRLIMQCQFRSISRGEHSIFGRLRNEGIDPEDYITFYSLRAWGKIGPRKMLVTEQLYIHAKAIIADDRVALIGSANINERSMLGVRDSECASIVRDTDMLWSTMAGRPYLVGRFAHTLRMRLMREHLGLDVDDIMEEERRAELDREEMELDAQMDRVYDDDSDAEISPSSQTKQTLASQAERLAGQEDRLSFNHDVDWAEEGNPHVYDDKKTRTSDKRVTGNASHGLEVDGEGKDQWKEAEKTGLSKGRDTALVDGLREVLVTDIAAEGKGTVQHPTKPHARASPTTLLESTSGTGNAGLPPHPPLPRRTTEQLGLPQLSQLPALPVLDDTDIGGPPALKDNVGYARYNPLTADIKRATLTKDCMRDPLNESFFEDTWHQIAENNTKIFRRVFRCNPDNEVTNWHDYTEFQAYAERFAQAQGAAKSTARQEQESKGKSGPPGAGSALPELGPVGEGFTKLSEKIATRDSNGHPLGTVKDWAKTAEKEHESRPDTGDNDEPLGEKNGSNQASANSPTLTAVGDATLPSLDSVATDGTVPDPEQPTEKLLTRRTTTFSTPTPEKLNGNGTIANGDTNQTSVKRRRRGTTRSRKGFSASDDLISREDAEELLNLVQGSLVVFPADWLKAEEHNSNWLYQVDQVAPLQI